MIVYKSTNLINKKVYIGITTRGFLQRKKEHIKYAFKYNSDFIFHKALREYGEESFTWEIIDFANSSEELNEKEIYWIEYYNSFVFNDKNNGYNMTLGGDGFRGIEHSNISINKGSKNPNAKINESDVLTIKELLKKNILTQREIAKKFNVSIDIISNIKKGKSWVTVGEDVSNIEYWNTKKLTDEEVLRIKELIKLKTPFEEIANEFNVAKITIQQIKKGITWSHVGEDVSYINYSNTKNSKLTEEDVRQIKLLIKEKQLKLKEIAAKFNINPSAVYNIKSGKTWVFVSV